MAVSAVAYAGHVFSDVSDSHTHANGIEWAKDTGLTVGCTEDGSQFCPERAMTRAEMVTMFKRYYDNIDKEGANIDEILNEINIDATDICEVFGFDNPCSDEMEELLRGDDGADGTDGTDGADGATGPAGADGYVGNILHNSVGGTIPANSTGIVEAECFGPEADNVLPDGHSVEDWTAISGGFTINSRNADVMVKQDRFIPFRTPEQHGWLVQFDNREESDQDVRTWVTCIYAPDDNPED